jgi:hypothetical protein
MAVAEGVAAYWWDPCRNGRVSASSVPFQRYVHADVLGDLRKGMVNQATLGPGERLQIPTPSSSSLVLSIHPR